MSGDCISAASRQCIQALQGYQWLLVDELNRADVDKSFGELMTVLAGGGTDTPFELDDGQRVSIGFESRRSHRVSRTFRVIATMNTWDKTSLFRSGNSVLSPSSSVQR